MAKNTLPNDDPFADTGTTDIGETGTDGVIDFSEIDENQIMPDHDVWARVVDSKAGQSKAGHAKIDLRWKLLDGQYEGRQLFDNISFHPNSLSAAKGRLKKMGIDGNIRASVADLAGMLLGFEVKIAVGTQPASVGADGKEYGARNKVAKIYKSEDTISEEPSF